MGLFSPEALMNASSILNAGDDNDPLAAIRQRHEDAQKRKDQIKQMIAAQMAMGQNQSPFGGIMNYFGGR
jgi:hypothetical protein